MSEPHAPQLEPARHSALPVLRRERVAVIVMALLMFGVYLVLAAGTQLWDRDEPRYARAAVEMWDGGDWLVPHVNDKPRLRKPPMVYWLMAPFVGVMGPTTIAVRMLSILATVGTGLLTWLCGRRLFGPAVGLWAMGLFATCGLTVYIGAASLIDATLVLFTTLAVFCFIDAVYRRQAWWHLPAIGLAMVSVMLLKGPLVLPVPVLACAVAAVLGRGELRLGRAWWLGFALCIVVSIAALVGWAIPADRATGGALYEIGFRQHVVGRMSQGMEGHGSSNLLEYIVMLPLYVPLLIACAFPWTLHLPGALRAMIGRRLGARRERAILWGWTVPWFVCVSLAATKLPHYLLPILPPLAIATAAGIDLRRRGGMTDKDRDWLRGGIWFFIPVALMMLAAIVAAPVLLDRTDLFVGVAPVAVVLGVVIIAAVYHQLRERVDLTARLLLVGTPIVIVMTVVIVLPGVEDRLKVSRDIGAKLHEVNAAEAPVVMGGFEEDSLYFYVDRPVGRPIEKLKSPAAIAAWLDRDQPGYLIVPEHRLDRALERDPALDYEVVLAKPIFDYNDAFKRKRILLVRRADQADR